MPIYDPAPEPVLRRTAAIIAKFHPDLQTVGIKLDILFAQGDEDSPAVSHGGYPAAAVIRITSAKERAAGRGDAEIVIDREYYEGRECDEERDALLDHELYHLEVKRDKYGGFVVDDHRRPKFKMRKHDHQFGWFDEIAKRHGRHSGEMQQAHAFKLATGQIYFDFEEGQSAPAAV